MFNKVFILFTLLLLSCSVQEKTGASLGTEVTEIDNRIWQIFQDSKGVYWFGSNTMGIYRYHNKSLINYTTEDGLIDNQIRGLQEDSQGRLLIETPKGVSRFNGEQFMSLEIDRSPDNQWQLEENDLWFNCNGNANHVYRYDGEKLIELKLPQQPLEEVLGISPLETRYSPYTVFGIDKDNEGNIWFGTVIAGAFRYDGKSFLWVKEKELSRLPDGREPGVRSMLQDRSGNYWLSNFAYNYILNADSSNAYYKRKPGLETDDDAHESIHYFNTGLIANNGDLWMATYGGEIFHFYENGSYHYESNFEDENPAIISIYQDKEDMIWVATDNYGIFLFYDDELKPFKPTLNRK